jgi:hypothetical protein
MRCIRARLGPLVQHESVVAWASTTADNARQERSAILGACGLPRRPEMTENTALARNPVIAITGDQAVAAEFISEFFRRSGALFLHGVGNKPPTRPIFMRSGGMTPRDPQDFKGG